MLVDVLVAVKYMRDFVVAVVAVVADVFFVVPIVAVVIAVAFVVAVVVVAVVAAVVGKLVVGWKRKKKRIVQQIENLLVYRSLRRLL